MISFLYRRIISFKLGSLTSLSSLKEKRLAFWPFLILTLFCSSLTVDQFWPWHGRRFIICETRNLQYHYKHRSLLPAKKISLPIPHLRTSRKSKIGGENKRRETLNLCNSNGAVLLLILHYYFVAGISFSLPLQSCFIPSAFSLLFSHFLLISISFPSPVAFLDVPENISPGS